MNLDARHFWWKGDVEGLRGIGLRNRLERSGWFGLNYGTSYGGVEIGCGRGLFFGQSLSGLKNPKNSYL